MSTNRLRVLLRGQKRLAGLGGGGGGGGGRIGAGGGGVGLPPCQEDSQTNSAPKAPEMFFAQQKPRLV